MCRNNNKKRYMKCNCLDQKKLSKPMIFKEMYIVFVAVNVLELLKNFFSNQYFDKLLIMFVSLDKERRKRNTGLFFKAFWKVYFLFSFIKYFLVSFFISFFSASHFFQFHQNMLCSFSAFFKITSQFAKCEAIIRSLFIKYHLPNFLVKLS